jgi:hypothetical protein
LCSAGDETFSAFQVKHFLNVHFHFSPHLFC